MLTFFFLDPRSVADAIGLMLDVAWELRWILVALGFLVLGCLYADALNRLTLVRDDNLDLAARNAELEDDRAELYQRLVARRRSAEIVRLPVRRAVR